MKIHLTETDRRCYEEVVRPFLPSRIVDVHTHVWTGGRVSSPDEPVRAVTWPSRVASVNPPADLAAAYRTLLPAQRVTPWVFGNMLSRAADFDQGNDYVRAAAERRRWPALLFARPDWSPDDLARRLSAWPWVGIKVYLSLAGAHLSERDITIFDFLPRSHLEVLDGRGLIVMLHVPRPTRIRDETNLAQIEEIGRRYPRVKTIVAHAGRAYCPEDVGGAYERLAGTGVVFDISANTNAENFERLLRAVGPKRVLYGSDMPITRMRMRRVCERGCYVNLVPRGLYGDVSGDPHMREVDGAEASRLTFFLYEEIAAFRRAAEACGLSRADVEDVFCRNALRLLGTAEEES